MASVSGGLVALEVREEPWKVELDPNAVVSDLCAGMGSLLLPSVQPAVTFLAVFDLCRKPECSSGVSQEPRFSE